MTRPSRNTDKLLIEAAKELIPKNGLSGLTVRDVARKAGVNLGMFNYHFKTKEAFLEKVLSESYEDFFKGLEIGSGTGGTPRERLKNAVAVIAFFVRDNRPVFIMLARELALGNRIVTDFAKKHMARHIELLIKLVKDCQKEGQMAKLPLVQVLPFLMGSVMAANFIVTAAERLAPLGSLGIARDLLSAAADKTILSDKAVEQRIDLALNALAPKTSKKDLYESEN
jgi:AcrR family transcriptional regulator